MLCSAGCGQVPAPSTTPAALHAPPTGYVLHLDRVPSPGFSVESPPQAAGPSALSIHTDVVGALRGAGLGGVASAHYLRTVPALATANGPLDVVAIVAAFSTGSGASRGLVRLVRELDARPGAAPLSTGDLGAESHAVTESAMATDGTPVVQVTVIWRVANLVNEMVVRGRLGATGLGDALVLARRQTEGEH